MASSHAELTAAEWSIIKAVWAAQPCTAPTIQQKLFETTQWTYSTVRTVMDRMAAKGLLKSEKQRNLTVYRAVLTREQAQQGELKYALKHAFNGALTPMLQCLLDTSDLTQRDLDELEALLKSKKAAKRDRSKGSKGQ